MHGCKERLHRGRLLRGGHPGQAHPVGAGRNHDHERTEVASQDAGLAIQILENFYGSQLVCKLSFGFQMLKKIS